MEPNTTLTLDTFESVELKANYILRLFSVFQLDEGGEQVIDFKFIPFVLFLLFCYLIGHLISAFSSFALERLIVRSWLKFPSESLMAIELCEPRILKRHRKPFGKKMRKKIRKAVDDTFHRRVEPSDYYWLLYSYVINVKPYLAPRVHHFVNLYGFSRNVSATFLIYVLFRFFFMFLVVRSPISFSTGLILVFYLIASGFMFWNYLKLFKRQAIDVFFLFLSVYYEKRGTLSRNAS